MDALQQIERALDEAVAHAEAPVGPPRLSEAIRYAVFPGGARIRPRLCLAAAWACGIDDPSIATAAAAAIELMHCASLVHDDLPCFDNAMTRRGKPSLHKAYGENIAVLTGDALIVLAFETLVRGAQRKPERLLPLVRLIGASVGAPSGIVAGQAWECEPCVSLVDYHRAKTGALFAAATVAGAIATGAEGGPWRAVGELIGEAYQVADDIRDMYCSQEEMGKPAGRDADLGRPSAMSELGLGGAIARLDDLIEHAVHLIPHCPGEAQLRALIQEETRRFLPKELAVQAARRADATVD